MAKNKKQRIDTRDLELSFNDNDDNNEGVMFIYDKSLGKIGDVYDELKRDVSFENFGELFENKQIGFNIKQKQYGQYKILRVKWRDGKYGTFERQDDSGNFKQIGYSSTQLDLTKGLECRWVKRSNSKSEYSDLKIYKGDKSVGDACEFKKNDTGDFVKISLSPNVKPSEKRIEELGGSFRILFGTSVPSDHLESVDVKLGKKVLKFKKVPVVQSIDDKNVYFVPENLVNDAEELEKEFIRKLHEKGFRIPSNNEKAPELKGGSVYKHEGDETYFIPEKWVEYAQSLEKEPSGESDENKTEENEKSGVYTLAMQGRSGRIFPLFNDKNVAGAVVKKGDEWVGYLTEKGRLDKKITSMPENGGVYSAVMKEQLEGKIKCSFRITNEDKENNVTIDNSEVYTVAQDGTGESWYISKGGKRINEGSNDSVEGALRGRLLSITDKGITVVNSGKLSDNVDYRAIGMDTKTTHYVYLEKEIKEYFLRTKRNSLKPIEVSNYSMSNVCTAKLDNTKKVYEVYRGSKLIGSLYTSGAQNVYNMTQIGTSEEDAGGRVAAKVEAGAPCYYMDGGELKSIPLKKAEFSFNELWWNNGKTLDENSKSNGEMVKEILNCYAKKFGVLLFSRELPIGGYPRGGYYNKFDGESFQALINLIENEVKNRLGEIKLDTENLLPGSHIIVGKKLEEYDSQQAKNEIDELDGAWEQFYKALEDKFKNESAKNQAAPEQKVNGTESVQVEAVPQVESDVPSDDEKEINAQPAEKDAAAEQKSTDAQTAPVETGADPHNDVVINGESAKQIDKKADMCEKIVGGKDQLDEIKKQLSEAMKSYNKFVEIHNDHQKKGFKYSGVLSEELSKKWESGFYSAEDSTIHQDANNMIEDILYACRDEDGLYAKVYSLLPEPEVSKKLMDNYVELIDDDYNIHRGRLNDPKEGNDVKFAKDDELVENLKGAIGLISKDIDNLREKEKEFEDNLREKEKKFKDKNSIFSKVKRFFGFKSEKKQQWKNCEEDIKKIFNDEKERFENLVNDYNETHKSEEYEYTAPEWKDPEKYEYTAPEWKDPGKINFGNENFERLKDCIMGFVDHLDNIRCGRIGSGWSLYFKGGYFQQVSDDSSALTLEKYLNVDGISDDKIEKGLSSLKESYAEAYSELEDVLKTLGEPSQEPVDDSIKDKMDKKYTVNDENFWPDWGKAVKGCWNRVCSKFEDVKKKYNEGKSENEQYTHKFLNQDESSLTYDEFRGGVLSTCSVMVNVLPKKMLGERVNLGTASINGIYDRYVYYDKIEFTGREMYERLKNFESDYTRAFDILLNSLNQQAEVRNMLKNKYGDDKLLGNIPCERLLYKLMVKFSGVKAEAENLGVKWKSDAPKNETKVSKELFAWTKLRNDTVGLSKAVSVKAPEEQSKKLTALFKDIENNEKEVSSLFVLMFDSIKAKLAKLKQKSIRDGKNASEQGSTDEWTRDELMGNGYKEQVPNVEYDEDEIKKMRERCYKISSWNFTYGDSKYYEKRYGEFTDSLYKIAKEKYEKIFPKKLESRSHAVRMMEKHLEGGKESFSEKMNRWAECTGKLNDIYERCQNVLSQLEKSSYGVVNGISEDDVKECAKLLQERYEIFEEMTEQFVSEAQLQAEKNATPEVKKEATEVAVKDQPYVEENRKADATEVKRESTTEPVVESQPQLEEAAQNSEEETGNVSDRDYDDDDEDSDTNDGSVEATKDSEENAEKTLADEYDHARSHEYVPELRKIIYKYNNFLSALEKYAEKFEFCDNKKFDNYKLSEESKKSLYHLMIDFLKEATVNGEFLVGEEYYNDKLTAHHDALQGKITKLCEKRKNNTLTDGDILDYKAYTQQVLDILERTERTLERKVEAKLGHLVGKLKGYKVYRKQDPEPVGNVTTNDAVEKAILNDKLEKARKKQAKQAKRENRSTLEKVGHKVKRGVIKTLRKVPVIGELPGIKQSDLKKLRDCYKAAADYVCHCAGTVEGSKLLSKFKPLSSVKTYKGWHKCLNKLFSKNLDKSEALTKLFVSFIGLNPGSVVSACEGLKLGGIDKNSGEDAIQRADMVRNILKNYCKGKKDFNEKESYNGDDLNLIAKDSQRGYVQLEKGLADKITNLLVTYSLSTSSNITTYKNCMTEEKSEN